MPSELCKIYLFYFRVLFSLGFNNHLCFHGDSMEWMEYVKFNLFSLHMSLPVDFCDASPLAVIYIYIYIACEALRMKIYLKRKPLTVVCRTTAILQFIYCLMTVGQFQDTIQVFSGRAECRVLRVFSYYEQ